MMPGVQFSIERQPLLAIWELTRACDLACAHCRACAVTERDDQELTTEEGFRLLDDLAAMGTPLVVLTGGDPARRPDLIELVRHGAKAGLSMAVTPSGTPSTTRALLQDLADAGLSRLAVSLDGPTAAVHDRFRGVNGSFDESLRILREAHAIGLPTQVNTSLHAGMQDKMAPMAALVAELAATMWSVFLLVPTGRATSSMLLGPKTVERLLEQLADIAGTAPFTIKTTAAPHFRRVLMTRKQRNVTGITRNVVDGPRGITDGVGFMFISHTGDVMPSGFLPVAAGNVRKDDVADVYREAPLFKMLRDADELGGKCGECPFRRVCGGSRARAYAMTGDPMAEDPLCAYQPREAGAS